MKHLVSAIIFVILCLGQAAAYGQDNTNPTNTPAPAVAEQDKGPAQKGDNETYEANGQSDEPSPPLIVMDKVSGKEIPVLSSSDKIAKKGNTYSFWQTLFSFGTLILAVAATCFAWGAWQEGKKGVEVTREATIAEYQPYLTFSNRIEFERIKTVELEGVITGATGPVTSFSLDIKPSISIKNEGRTPALKLFLTFNGIISVVEPQIQKNKAKIVPRECVFEGVKSGPSYLGKASEKSVWLNYSLTYDSQEKYRVYDNLGGESNIPTFEADFFNAYVQIEIIVSFSDRFTKTRRAFLLRYFGRIDDKWVTLVDSRELETQEPEYKENQEEFEKYNRSLERSKPS